MNTRNLMRKLPSCLLGAIFVFGVASTTVNAVDGDPPGLFELEDNIPDDGGVDGDDWGSLFDGTNLGSPLVTTFDDTDNGDTFETPIVNDPAPLTIFFQGGSKDVNDVSQWKHTDGAVPDKDDITDAYAAGYSNPADVCLNLNPALPAVLCTDGAADTDEVVHEAGDLIIYFGLDRLANNGDANAGFWFFQHEVHLNDGTFVDGDGNPATHVAKTATTPGDVFIIVKYPQGSGAVPLIKAYEWDPNDADNDDNEDPDEKSGKFSPLDLLVSEANALCDGNGGKLACAITNTTDDASPPWDYTPKTGSGLPHESFYEGGINISQLLGSTPCFASFLAETRSSESQSAQLKDFVLSNFPVCSAEVTKTCTADIDEAGDALVDFKGIVSNTGGQSLYIVLEDSQPGSVFTAVCFDNDASGTCGTPGDTLPADPTPGTIESFTLDGGDDVLYEGNYTESPASGLTFSDTVTMNFFSDSEQTEPIDTKTATANCLADVTPGILVTKVCDPALGGGSGVRLAIVNGQVVVEVGNIITVENTGNEALTNVVISDTEVQSLVQTSGPTLTCTAANGGDAECTGDLAIDDVVVFTQTYLPDGGNITGDLGLPNSVFFDNTASGEGDGALSGGHVSDTDDASCELCPADD